MNWDTLKDPSENEYFQFIDEKQNVFKVYPVVQKLSIQWTLAKNNKVLGTYGKAEDAKEEINKRFRKPHKVGDVVHRKWGFYKILAIGYGYLVKELNVNPNKTISYQSHTYRAECWNIIDGNGIFKTEKPGNYCCSYEVYKLYNRYLTAPTIPLKEVKETKNAGDVIKIEVQQKHGFTAGDKGCRIVEIWSGTKLEEYDIIRFEEN